MDPEFVSFHAKFVKTHPDAVLPTKKRDDDIGYDLTAVEDVSILGRSYAVVPVGLQVAYIEPGWWFKIEARSGLGFKHHIFPHFGIIDTGYRGDCGVKLYNFGQEVYEVKKGDRIAQIVFYPQVVVEFEWVDKIMETDRGEKGFGSSDQES